MSGNFIYRHHVEPRVKLYSPREESFPIPLKYIDVSRTTHTNLDVKQERRIDDYWNIDGSRDLSDYWTGFTQFTPVSELPVLLMHYLQSREQKWYRVSRGNICLSTKISWAPCRRRTGEAARLAEKFVDLITADHKVLNEESASRNNHRYAVVVQDLATQWIQSHPCTTKT